jgi:Flp pilus assembly protein TadG
MRKTHLKKLRKFNSAQAMVEFLIVLPVMLLLVLGILQFSFIYQAKTTLNYAAFETARAGSLHNADMGAMQIAFSSYMAPLYTTSYLTMDGSGNCGSNFTIAGRATRLGGAKITQAGNQTRGVLDNNINDPTKFGSGNVYCARRVVQQQIIDGYVNIQRVNPTTEAFANYGVDTITPDGSVERAIPNDNLMYRDSTVLGTQSIQDANLLKIHIGYCYELIVPFVDRIIWSFHALASGRNIEDTRTQTGTTNDSAYFGTPAAGFAQQCITNATKSDGSQRYSVVLNAQGIMRMQTPAIQ